MTKYLYGLKKTCLGVLERGERDNDNETSLKGEEEIKMSTTVLHKYSPSFRERLLSL